jgi:hypothetical protein
MWAVAAATNKCAEQKPHLERLLAGEVPRSRSRRHRGEVPVPSFELDRRLGPHPWTVYVADAIHQELEPAVRALADDDGAEE